MPATTLLQKAAFDAIDTLHFSQIIGFFCGDKVAEQYRRIIDRINEILREKEIVGKQAEISKHYILANLEICLSIDNKFISDMVENLKENNVNNEPYDKEEYKKSVEDKKNHTLSILSIIAGENGIDGGFIKQIVEDLINDETLSLSTLPFFIKYRLTERCYAIEYPDAAFRFYHELVSRNIILCKKYSRKVDKHAPNLDSELSLLFIRAGLFFEFRMFQRAINVMIAMGKNNTITFPTLDPNVSHTERKMIADYYKRLIDIFLLEEKKSTCVFFRCKEHVSGITAEKLLKNMSQYYFHKRMFGGTQGSWLGTLGAFELEIRSLEEPNKAIYYEADNSHTISEKVRLKFWDYGFSVSARSLYLRDKKIRMEDGGGYDEFEHYGLLLMKEGYMQPWYLNHDHYYDSAFKYKKYE